MILREDVMERFWGMIMHVFILQLFRNSQLEFHNQLILLNFLHQISKFVRRILHFQTTIFLQEWNGKPAILLWANRKPWRRVNHRLVHVSCLLKKKKMNSLKTLRTYSSIQYFILLAIWYKIRLTLIQYRGN